MGTRLSADELVDRLVEKLNSLGAFEPFPAEEVPPFLRAGPESEYPGYYSWRIRRLDLAPWLDEFDRKLSKPLPPTFRSLIRRYAFMEFEIEPLLMCANTGTNIYEDFVHYIGRDAALQDVLVPAGYLHFARLWTGDYDPICFDTTRNLAGEYPIVQIDHEEILCNHRLEVVAELAPSFRRLVEDWLDQP